MGLKLKCKQHRSRLMVCLYCRTVFCPRCMRLGRRKEWRCVPCGLNELREANQADLEAAPMEFSKHLATD
jgi:hypothetical protein